MKKAKNYFRFADLKLEKLEDKCFLHRIVAKNMGIVYCEYQKGWVHKNIKHPNEEFMYIVSGHLKAHIGKANHHLKKGEGVVIPPHRLHSFVAMKKTIALIIFSPPITSRQAQAYMKKLARIKKGK